VETLTPEGSEDLMNDNMPWSELGLLEKAVVVTLIGVPILLILHAAFC
jgi:hypothetical protein